jgi:hypothetical protein
MTLALIALCIWNIFLTFVCLRALDQRDQLKKQYANYVPRNIGVDADGSTWYTRPELEKRKITTRRNCFDYGDPKPLRADGEYGEDFHPV